MNVRMGTSLEEANQIIFNDLSKDVTFFNSIMQKFVDGLKNQTQDEAEAALGSVFSPSAVLSKLGWAGSIVKAAFITEQILGILLAVGVRAEQEGSSTIRNVLNDAMEELNDRLLRNDWRFGSTSVFANSVAEVSREGASELLDRLRRMVSQLEEEAPKR